VSDNNSCIFCGRAECDVISGSEGAEMEASTRGEGESELDADILRAWTLLARRLYQR